jgi:hypothetical protein
MVTSISKGFQGVQKPPCDMDATRLGVLGIASAALATKSQISLGAFHSTRFVCQILVAPSLLVDGEYGS